MKKRLLVILLCALVTVLLLPATAFAAGSDITVCGETWSTSTYAKITDGQPVTDGASAEDYNIHWDAETQTLTLQDAALSVQDVAAIFAELETLNIHLIGRNTITVENMKDNRNYAAVSNSQKISITGEVDASLSISVSQKQSELSNTSLVGISAGTGLANSTAVAVKVNSGADVKYTQNLYGIKIGNSSNQHGSLENSGSIAVKVCNDSCDIWYGSNAYAIFIFGGEMQNSSSGTLNLQASAKNGKVYGLRGTGTTELWNNEGNIISNVTAYGGNHEDFDSNIYKASNYACAVSIVTTDGDGINMTNSGNMDLDAVNYGQNRYYEYAIGLELDSNATRFRNSGTIDIKALEAYTWGIYLSNLTDDAVLENSGDITIEATTNGKMCESPDSNPTSYSVATGIGINMWNSDQTPEPVRTQMLLESGSKLDITTKASGSGIVTTSDWDAIGMTEEQWKSLMEMLGISGETAAQYTYEDWVNYQYCQAIQLQKVFEADPGFEEVPQDISLADDLVILKGEGMYDGGKLIAVFEDYYVDVMGIYPYINTIGNEFEDSTTGETYSVPSKKVVILPALPGTVSIDGTARVGSTLTAQVSGLPENTAVIYQWQVGYSADGPFIDIENATAESYKLTDGEKGKYVRVAVTPVSDSGYAGTLSAVTEQAVTSASGTKTYTVTTEDAANGEVKSSHSRTNRGTTVTLTAIPVEGYELDTLTVTDSNGEKIKLVDKGNGKYAFTMPASRVTVKAVFAETVPSWENCDGGEGCPLLKYTDLDADAWYHDGIHYCVENSLMKGTGKMIFEPQTSTTRGMIVTILYRLADESKVTGALPFDDVEADAWYADAVAWAEKNDIVNGYGDRKFGPEDAITREQMAAIIYRYGQYKGYDVTDTADLSGFTDSAAVSAWAQTVLEWANANELVNGTGGNLLDPKGSASRAQAAAILQRFCREFVK